MDSSKSWVWNGVAPLKPNKGIATKTIGEHGQAICRVRELYPSSQFSFFPPMLFVKKNPTFERLGSRDILPEVVLPESIRVDVE